MIRSRRERAERGASLIEVGLVVPILLLLGIGLTEIGFLVVDYVTVTNSARSGARTGSAAASEAAADDEILQVVEEDACNLLFGDLVRVTIFLPEADGSIPADSSKYRIYEPSGALLCDNTSHNLTLQSGTWAPGDRDDTLPDLDRLGVHVEFSHTKVTNLIPFSVTNWTETAVMQIEPDTKG